MRWGKHKGTSGESTTVVRTRNSEDHDKKVALKGKKLSEMTNEELRSYTQRAMLEKQYKELSKTELTRGQKIVKSILNTAAKGATDAANDYIKKYSAKKVDELIKKMGAVK
jgi:hypothetical protein